MPFRTIILSLILSALAGSGVAAQLSIELAHHSEAERATRDALLRLVEERNLAKWIRPTKVVVDGRLGLPRW